MCVKYSWFQISLERHSLKRWSRFWGICLRSSAADGEGSLSYALLACFGYIAFYFTIFFSIVSVILTMYSTICKLASSLWIKNFKKYIGVICPAVLGLYLTETDCMAFPFKSAVIFIVTLIINFSADTNNVFPPPSDWQDISSDHWLFLSMADSTDNCFYCWLSADTSAHP